MAHWWNRLPGRGDELFYNITKSRVHKAASQLRAIGALACLQASVRILDLSTKLYLRYRAYVRFTVSDVDKIT